MYRDDVDNHLSPMAPFPKSGRNSSYKNWQGIGRRASYAHSGTRWSAGTK